MKNKLAVALVTLLAIGGAAAYAAQINGLGSTYWAITQDFTTSSACVRSGVTGAAATVCALFPAGDGPDHQRKLSIVDSPGAIRCCWVGIAALGVTATLEIDNGSDDGQGNCIAIGANGGVKTKRPSRIAMLENGSKGLREGLCSTPLTTAAHTTRSGNEREIYWPCGDDAHCADVDTGAGTLALGTCNLTPTSSQRAAAGLILNCVAPSATAGVVFEKEWVQQ